MKKGTLILYDIYGTLRGVRSTQIYPINDTKIHCSYYLIVGKVVKNYTKNECMLDAIMVAEFTKNGTPLNWCQYILIEVLQGCT